MHLVDLIIRPCVLVWQLPALQEACAVGWIAKESPINFWQGKLFSSLQSIQTTSETGPPSYSVSIQVKWLGQEATAYVCLVPGVGMFGAVCTAHPRPSVPTLWR